MDGGFIGFLQFDLRLRDAVSLKDKRRLVSAVKNGLARRYGAAVAEVAHHDLRQRAVVTAAFVDRAPSPLEDRLHAAERWMEQQPVEASVVRSRIVGVEDLD